MKPLTIILFVTIASAVVLSVLFQNKIEELSTQLDDVRTNLVDTKHQLDKAQKSQKDAEREMNVAQDQSETAYVNLHKVQRQLTEQKKRADQFAEENQGLRGMLLQPEERVAQLEAASKALNTRYDLKLAEYQTFVEKAAQELAAKDEKNQRTERRTQRGSKQKLNALIRPCESLRQSA